MPKFLIRFSDYSRLLNSITSKQDNAALFIVGAFAPEGRKLDVGLRSMMNRRRYIDVRGGE